MSNKKTIISLPSCHIFKGVSETSGRDTLVISVDYGYEDDGVGGNNYIEVIAESDFAKIVMFLLKDKTEEQLRDVVVGR